MKPRITAAAGLVSAVLVLGALMLFVGGTGQAQTVHVCSPTDRQFIGVAQLNMASLSSASEDFLRGGAKPASVIDVATQSLQNVQRTHPEDPSLTKTRAILGAMFVEYGKAIRADAKHKDPGTYIYRAYGLANFAHDVLAQAQRPLEQRGCDVSPLL
ncbi:MAG: hypothetical protein E6G13_03245 [Actinobacteria bacterium]|nr:MAG: hypothetical protein E6G13_03245 [Actinomycetota bacterium]